MSASTADRWLRGRGRAAPARRRLLCFPYAGGGATLYHRWSDRLPADVEVLAVQAPGRQERLREEPLRRLDELVDHVVEAFASLPALPTTLYGHSFGALTAFEFARRRQAAGAPVVALVVGAMRAPQLPSRDLPQYALAHEPFLAALHERYGTPWEILRNEALMAMALPSLRADLEALETYRYAPGAALQTPIIALYGLRDPRVTPEEAAAWAHVTSRSAAVHALDAGHFFIDTHGASTIERVAAALAG